jgi:hypothetical protein
VITGNTILYGFPIYVVGVIAVAVISGGSGRPLIVDVLLIVGSLLAVAILGARSLVRGKVLLGGLIVALLLMVTIAVLLFANPAPIPLFIGLLVLYGAAGIAFVLRPMEI